MRIIFLLFWSLQICVNVAAAPAANLSLPPTYHVEVDDGTYGFYPIRTYATAQDVTSPQTNFLQWDSRCDDGSLVMITPRGYSLDNPGPMLLDPRGNLVWAHHFENDFGGQAYGLAVQKYQGEDYLTFWLGDDRVKGHGSGSYYMVSMLVWLCELCSVITLYS